MPLEHVTIMAGSSILPWQSVEISSSADEAVRTATVRFHLPPGQEPPWPDTPATISAGGDVLLTGYVRDYDPSQDVEGWSATVSFVSRTVDAVETSIVHPTGFVKQKDIKGVGEAFDTCGVGIEVKGSFSPIARHQIVPGESLFSTLEPLARAEAAIIQDTPDGKLRIVKKPDPPHAGGLAAGVNIISASASFSGQGRHDPVIARGQLSRGTDAKAMRPESKAAAGGSRYRPKIVIADGEATPDRLKNAVEWEMRNAAGLAVTATVEVSGWRDQGGKIWERNRLVYVRHPRISLDQMMVIKTVTLSQDQSEDGEGTRATLTLADPRSLGGGASGSKSGAGWSAPEPSASFEAK